MSIVENLQHVRATLPDGITLVAVSKYHPVEALRMAYDAGQRIFGESREKELVEKHAHLPADVEWHFIGHLQTNKVKYIAPFVSLIHSVDSGRLLDEINKQAMRAGRASIDVLLELHVAQEETKSGLTPDEAVELVSTENVRNRWPYVRLRGVMGMASLTDDVEQQHREFRALATAFDRIADVLRSQGIGNDTFNVRSYGMTDDYFVAIDEKSNMVRVGTAIFGPREY